jgi:hypothetical protein
MVFSISALLHYVSSTVRLSTVGLFHSRLVVLAIAAERGAAFPELLSDAVGLDLISAMAESMAHFVGYRQVQKLIYRYVKFPRQLSCAKWSRAEE